MNEHTDRLVDGCQPSSWLSPSTKREKILPVSTIDDEKAQAKAIQTIGLLVEMSGSLQRACNEIMARTGQEITAEGIRKALKEKRVGEKLMGIATALESASQLNSMGAMRFTEYEDRYPNRPAALALLVDKIEPATINALRLVSTKASEQFTTDQWFAEGLRLQIVRNGTPKLFGQDEPLPPGPDLSPAALSARAKKKR